MTDTNKNQTLKGNKMVVVTGYNIQPHKKKWVKRQATWQRGNFLYHLGSFHLITYFFDNRDQGAGHEAHNETSMSSAQLLYNLPTCLSTLRIPIQLCKCGKSAQHQPCKPQKPKTSQDSGHKTLNLMFKEKNLKTTLYCWIVGSGHWTFLWFSSQYSEMLD